MHKFINKKKNNNLEMKFQQISCAHKIGMKADLSP